MTQPEALRLADSLEQDYCSCHEGFKLRNRIDPQCESCQTKDWRNEAAAELRRLHAENEVTVDLVKELVAQRDALLEALQWIADHDLLGTDLMVAGHIAHGFIGTARAAIAKAEGEKT